MTEGKKSQSWLVKRAEGALRKGFTHAYNKVKVDPEQFLMKLRVSHSLPVQSFQGVFSVPVEQLDAIAADTVSAALKVASVEGAGLGFGGVFTLVPDLSILSVITLRTIQKLSLIYGFEFNTENEVADLWIAAASAAGVDISRELIEKQVVSRFVPKVIQRIAAQASAEVVEKWAGRIIPVVSSVIGAALNYYFVRTWSERAIRHFREKHLASRERMAGGILPGEFVHSLPTPK